MSQFVRFSQETVGAVVINLDHIAYIEPDKDDPINKTRIAIAGGAGHLVKSVITTGLTFELVISRIAEATVAREAVYEK